MKDISAFLNTFDKVESVSFETGIDKNTILKILDSDVELTYEGVLDFFKKKKEEISKIEFDKIKMNLKNEILELNKKESLVKKYLGKDITPFEGYDKTDDDWWIETDEDGYHDLFFALFDMASYVENNSDVNGNKLVLIFKAYNIEIFFKSMDKIKTISDIVRRNNYNNEIGDFIGLGSKSLKRNDIKDIFMVLYDNKKILEIDNRNDILKSHIVEFNKDEYFYNFNDSENLDREAYEKYRLSLNKNIVNDSLSKTIKYIEETKKDINTFISLIGTYERDANAILKEIKEDNFKEINQKYKDLKNILDIYQNLIETKINISKKLSSGIVKYYK